MNRTSIVKIVITLVKAVLIAGAILYLGSYFGLHVREAGGGTYRLTA